jgi:uncharacterized membrane protein YhhN
MIVVATLVSALACLVLIAAEYKHASTLRAVSKIIASLAFIAVGLLAAHTHGDPAPSFDRHIVLGLVLGAIGDAALLGKTNRAFMAGLVAFLLGHLAYVIACIHLVDPRNALSLAGPYGIIPAVIGIGALLWLWPRLGKMRIAVIVYVAIITSMVIAAIAVARSEYLPSRNRDTLLAGAILFFASDFAVARDKFVDKSFVNRAWGLPAYYAGQLLIAWSLAA